MREAEFSAGALQEVLDAVFGYFADRQFMAVRVVVPQPPDPDAELDVATGADLRDWGRNTLRLRVITGLVTSLRTMASGDRIPLEARVDNEKHDWIREKSPFRPYRPGDDQRRDVLRKDELDNYLFRLSRHPGRRVDASISPAQVQDPYGINLDYLVTENKDWLVYAQLSNTGTEETSEWRQRVGLFSNQLTGNDDLLNVDFITSSFDETNAVFGEYNAPLIDLDVLRGRVYGSWSEYSASDVGFANQRFDGESWQLGGALVWNVYQDRQLFIDVLAGARYEDVEVDNKIVAIDGHEDFFLPHVGVHLQRYTEEASTDLNVTLEWQLGNVTGVDEAELNRLGRFDADEDWVVLHWDAVQSFYLEPLFNRAAWLDVSTPESSTLAHEIWLRFRGQYAFDNRLIPQEQMVAGGLYSVRGYEQSVSVGDTVLLGTVEYRFHVPRAFGFEPQPATFLDKPFRVVPQFPYGRADWDLILRGFLDVGRTINSDKLSFEEDDTLVGMGIGVELQYRTNLNIRLDWGVALESIEDKVDSGSSEVHFIATLMF
jgi:hemolysin activation/secretion protein